MPYYVYILSSRSRNIYTGVTNNIFRRVWQHREGRASRFTQRYNIHRLVYFEGHGEVYRAIAREKQIKSWTRAKRVALIESENPRWDDLAARWYDDIWKGPADPSSSSPASRTPRDDTSGR